MVVKYTGVKGVLIRMPYNKKHLFYAPLGDKQIQLMLCVTDIGASPELLNVPAITLVLHSDNVIPFLLRGVRG